jgi:hypothetical protein
MKVSTKVYVFRESMVDMTISQPVVRGDVSARIHCLGSTKPALTLDCKGPTRRVRHWQTLFLEFFQLFALLHVLETTTPVTPVRAV